MLVGITVLKTGAFNHSATPPNVHDFAKTSRATQAESMLNAIFLQAGLKIKFKIIIDHRTYMA